jgi:hypothetical protein
MPRTPLHRNIGTMTPGAVRAARMAPAVLAGAAAVSLAVFLLPNAGPRRALPSALAVDSAAGRVASDLGGPSHAAAPAIAPTQAASLPAAKPRTAALASRTRTRRRPQRPAAKPAPKTSAPQVAVTQRAPQAVQPAAHGKGRALGTTRVQTNRATSVGSKAAGKHKRGSPPTRKGHGQPRAPAGKNGVKNGRGGGSSAGGNGRGHP